MIFVFGNGLSAGFDGRLATASITERVLASLGEPYAEVLRELAELAHPEDPDTEPVDVDRGDFEKLAGPLDRLADALLAVQRLFTGGGTAPVADNLREAADGLRQHYVRIVGTVLREVDTCCVDLGVGDERRAAWEAMNAFAAELVKIHANIFTLNYDSLLMSAMLEQGKYVYDGFRFHSLNVPLDRWAEPTTLYQLHGSVSWHWEEDGLVQKRKLREVREEGVLDAWAGGSTDVGLPAVVLSDLKTRYTEQYPFSILYDELHRELSNESLVVVGGYSFGDRPLNRALARFLARNAHNGLLIWNPRGTREAYLDRLRKQLLQNENAINDEQVIVERVTLPDAEALRDLWRRLHPDEER